MHNRGYRLQDKVAIVTGGASGIGKATVHKLLSEGASVVAADINLAGGSQLLDEFSAFAKTGALRFFPCDVTLESDIEHLVRFTTAAFQRLDCLVNNAGTGGALTPLLETSVEDWDKTLAVILRSVYLGIKYAAKAMIAQGSGGAIVNLGSIAGHSGGAGGAAYSAAKAGVINLTRAAAVQLAPHRIRCNSVSPGTVLTPLLMRGRDEQAFRTAAIAVQPWPEPGLPEHITGPIAFLCSDEATFITGSDLLADGGGQAAGTNLYRGNNPLGNEIVESIKHARLPSFDVGSTVTAGATFGSNLEFMTPETRQTQRVVVLTGVSRGLGLALAEELIGMGQIVVGCARSPEKVEELRARFPEPHRFHVVDVSDDESVKQWSEELARARLAPSLLVNNAAISNSSNQLWRISAAEFAEVLKVNVEGTANVLRHFVPQMLRSKAEGIIVNFSSGWGREAAARVAPYCASKWAVEGMTRALACELPPKIAVVSLHPGIIQTDTLAAAFGEAASRYPTPQQWAKIAAPYLLSIACTDNGRALTVPGMSNFLGMGRV